MKSGDSNIPIILSIVQVCLISRISSKDHCCNPRVQTATTLLPSREDCGKTDRTNDHWRDRTSDPPASRSCLHCFSSNGHPNVTSSGTITVHFIVLEVSSRVTTLSSATLSIRVSRSQFPTMSSGMFLRTQLSTLLHVIDPLRYLMHQGQSARAIMTDLLKSFAPSA
jgi:hypothetical protein